MFRTFASAALASAAIAKGLNDGSSRDNAVSTQLLAEGTDSSKINLTVNSYNSDNAGTLEFHGDLTADWKGNLAYNFVYGFCFTLASNQAWDCMRVETNLNVEKNKDALQAKAFVIQDQYISTFAYSQAGMKNDASYLAESADKSWMHVADKSNKACA